MGLTYLHSTAFLPEVNQVFHGVAVALNLQSAQLEIDCIDIKTTMLECESDLAIHWKVCQVHWASRL